MNLASHRRHDISGKIWLPVEPHLPGWVLRLEKGYPFIYAISVRAVPDIEKKEDGA